MASSKHLAIGSLNYAPFFKLSQGQSSTFILVYVDDILIAGNDLSAITNLKTMLAHHFHIKDPGKLKYFLGLEVAHSPTSISLNQRKYALDILADSGHLGTRPTAFPMEQNLKLNNADGDLLPDPSSFRRLVGRLIYLNITRSDIVFFSQYSEPIYASTATAPL
jgi:hypothetical protein